jgi:hypothetical protein
MEDAVRKSESTIYAADGGALRRISDGIMITVPPPKIDISRDKKNLS